MGQRLVQLAELVAGARSGEDLVRPLLRLLAHSTGMEAALLTEPDEEPGMQRLAYVHDVGMGIEEGLRIPWTDTLCKNAFDAGRLYVQCTGTPFADLWIVKQYRIRTFLTTPVNLNGEVHGTLCALSRHDVAMTTNATWTPDVFARLIGEFAARERMVRESEAEQQRLALRVHEDALTQLPNREYVLENLARMLEWSRRDRMDLLVGFIDLSDFKAVNDRHGQRVGDLFLVAMAERLRASLRRGDLLGRVGGDEFILVAPVKRGTAPRAREVLSSWLTRRAVTAFELEGIRVQSSGASVGLVEARPEDGVAEVIARAVAAVSAAKRGRSLQAAVSATSGDSSR